MMLDLCEKNPEVKKLQEKPERPRLDEDELLLLQAIVLCMGHQHKKEVSVRYIKC